MVNFSIIKNIKAEYSTNYPFPHIVLDNFMDPIYLKKSIAEFNRVDWGFDNHEESTGEHQRNKLYAPHFVDGYYGLPEYTRNILSFMNSREMLVFLEELTGIQNLIPDPGFYGGGIHRIKPGGKLSVHADYNYHPITKLHRRINLLLYLNQDWKEEWGGDLQLWTKDLKTCVKKILPLFNRAVIFNITSDAYHGHPGILKSPEGIDRYSFALYYFTEDRPEHEKTNPHMAVFHHT
jgi:Rps23 Pro-64 3,4-dihydroxylase Tpa1-like proline 4-hydroxylase